MTPEAGRPTKMRRNRSAQDASGIRSRLPTSENPRSREVIRSASSSDALAPTIVDARGGTEELRLRDVMDRVVCGDAATTLARLPAAFATCAVTSPPYWHMVDYGCAGQIGQGSYDEYRQSLTSVWQGVSRALKPNGKFCLNVPLLPLSKSVSASAFGKSHTRVVLDLFGDLKSDLLAATDLAFYGLYIWEKQTTEKMFGSYPYPPNLYERNYIEFIGVFVKPGEPAKLPKAVKEAARLSVEEWMELTKQIWWMYPENVARDSGHPAPFPEALPNRLISMYTFPRVAAAGFSGDVVLDPFAGWGTTCVAAKRLGRRFVGIDLSPRFCNEAERRLAAVEPRRTVMPAQRTTERCAENLPLFQTE